MLWASTARCMSLPLRIILTLPERFPMFVDELMVWSRDEVEGTLRIALLAMERVRTHQRSYSK